MPKFLTDAAIIAIARAVEAYFNWRSKLYDLQPQVAAKDAENETWIHENFSVPLGRLIAKVNRDLGITEPEPGGDGDA